MKLIKNILLAIFFLPVAVFASPKMHLQMGKSGLEMVVYDGEDKEVGVAQVKPESWNWNTAEASNYTVRWEAGSIEYTYHHHAQSQNQSYFTQQGQRVPYQQMDLEGKKVGGQFVTGVQGYIEKWSKRDGERETLYLVFRNNQGQFMTSLSLANYVTSNWEEFEWKDGSYPEWRYVYRWSDKSGTNLVGRFFNHVGLDVNQCFWNRQVDTKCPIIPVRETSEKNNGVFVTLLTGKYKFNRRHRAYYCKYYVPENDSKNPGRLITSIKKTKIDQVCN